MESTSSNTLQSKQLCSPTKYIADCCDRNKILCTIAEKCEEEMQNDCLKIPLEDYTERVVHYTGLSKETINQAIAKNLQAKYGYNKNKHFELRIRINLLKFLSNFYIHIKNPTTRTIFTWYEKTYNPIEYSMFQYKMCSLGLKSYKTEMGKEIIFEDPSLSFERYLYLKRLHSFRSKGASIYYIDEIFLDSTYKFLKPWINDIDISSPTCDGYVFFHAVSRQGFVNGLFCSPTTKTDFTKWICNILMPLLPKSSVIVMDKNDLHGSLMNKITKYHSKKDMLHYLRQRNIPCSEKMHKAELFQLISKCSVQEVFYDVDQIFQSHGHHVLRLPTNFHDLSLTHFLWHYFLNSEPDLFLKLELSQAKLLLLERLNSIPQYLWESIHIELNKCEEEILQMDSNNDEAIEAGFAIDLKSLEL